MKKIITFFFLSFLLGGVFSEVKAQINVSMDLIEYDWTGGSGWIEYLGKYWPETTDKNEAIQMDIDARDANVYPVIAFEGCPLKLRVTLDAPVPTDGKTYLKFDLIDESLVTSGYYPDGLNTKEYLMGLPDSILLTPEESYFEFPYSIRHMPESENGKFAFLIGGLLKDGVAIGAGGDGSHLRNRFTYHVDYNKPTVLHKGKLNLNIKGASKHIVRSLDGGYTWKPDSVPITDSEIRDIENVGVIYIKEPFSCILETITFGNNQGGNPVMRPVFIPKVNNAILNYSQGEHFVASRTNFVFTIQPTGDNAGKVPVVKTDRTSIPDSEGVLVEKMHDGSYKVTIIYVQNAINLSIDFTTGNDVIDGGQVWVANDQLHITSTAAGDAKVYSTAGSLVKTIALSSGETKSTALSAGFYVVSLNGKSYKVVVR